jgi:PAS domain S-box-containing protein
VLGDGWMRALHPHDRERIARVVDEAGTAGIWQSECRLRRASDGTYRWHLASSLPVQDSDGQVTAWFGTATDIEEQRRGHAALLASEDRFRRLVESSIFGLTMGDASGRLTYVNDALLRTLGCTREEVESGELRWDAITPPEYLPLDERANAQIRDHGRCEPFEKEYVAKDGRRIPVLIGVAPIERGEDGRTVSAAYVIDITERKRAEEALRAADRRKDEFLALLSHELRNPLAPIRNSLAILTRVPGDAERAPLALAVIDRQVTHLTRLVEDLLDVNRITRGKVQLCPGRVELRTLVQLAVEDLQTVLAASRLSITVDLGPNPLWVRADPARIKQVLGNLLDNAAKFTPPGGRVAVAVEQAADGCSAQVRVEDTGAGIDPEMMPRLFQPFAQANATLARTKGGLGLGLALVKGVVELHGGSVSASSKGPGRGSEFAFWLPLEGPAPVPSPVPRAGHGSASRRVLIVDDNEDFAVTLQIVLEAAGHEAHVVFNGADGLEAARRIRPDVILCDIGLPGMDGYQVARALRSPDVGFSGKLIAVSGYASSDDQRLAAEAGFDHHLAKPPALEVLTALLSDSADLSRTR